MMHMRCKTSCDYNLVSLPPVTAIYLEKVNLHMYCYLIEVTSTVSSIVEKRKVCS